MRLPAKSSLVNRQPNLKTTPALETKIVVVVEAAVEEAVAASVVAEVAAAVEAATVVVKAAIECADSRHPQEDASEPIAPSSIPQELTTRSQPEGNSTQGLLQDRVAFSNNNSRVDSSRIMVSKEQVDHAPEASGHASLARNVTGSLPVHAHLTIQNKMVRLQDRILGSKCSHRCRMVNSSKPQDSNLLTKLAKATHRTVAVTNSARDSATWSSASTTIFSVRSKNLSSLTRRRASILKEVIPKSQVAL